MDCGRSKFGYLKLVFLISFVPIYLGVGRKTLQVPLEVPVDAKPFLVKGLFRQRKTSNVLTFWNRKVWLPESIYREKKKAEPCFEILRKICKLINGSKWYLDLSKIILWNVTFGWPEVEKEKPLTALLTSSESYTFSEFWINASNFQMLKINRRTVNDFQTIE